MEVRFIAEFKSINRISPLVWEIEHIIGKDKARMLVQTPCKLMVENWMSGDLNRTNESQRVLIVFDAEPNKAYRLHQRGESYCGYKEHVNIKCLHDMNDYCICCNVDLCTQGNEALLYNYGSFVNGTVNSYNTTFDESQVEIIPYRKDVYECSEFYQEVDEFSNRSIIFIYNEVYRELNKCYMFTNDRYNFIELTEIDKEVYRDGGTTNSTLIFPNGTHHKWHEDTPFKGDNRLITLDDIKYNVCKDTHDVLEKLTEKFGYKFVNR